MFAEVCGRSAFFVAMDNHCANCKRSNHGHACEEVKNILEELTPDDKKNENAGIREKAAKYCLEHGQLRHAPKVKA